MGNLVLHISLIRRKRLGMSLLAHLTDRERLAED
jgi:hypothetical protein